MKGGKGGAGFLIAVVAVGFIALTAFTDKMMGRQVLTRAEKEAANRWYQERGFTPRYKL